MELLKAELEAYRRGDDPRIGFARRMLVFCSAVAFAVGAWSGIVSQAAMVDRLAGWGAGWYEAAHAASARVEGLEALLEAQDGALFQCEARPPMTYLVWFSEP